MSKFKPQYRRLLFIDRRLRGGRYPNCRSLAAEWEVSARTIQRDLDYLRYELGAPIAYDRPRNGFGYTEENYRLPAVALSESDLLAVCLAAKALKQFVNTPLHDRLASVFEKLRQCLPGNIDLNPDWVANRILFFPEATTTIDAQVWDAVAAAIRSNHRVRIVHKSPGRKRATGRKIDPYHLVNYRGEWYMTGFCHRRKSIRTFAVSRIRRIDALQEPFTMPDGCDADTLFGDRFGIAFKEPRYRVRIHFAASIAPYIREREWHAEQQVNPAGDGSLTLAFMTNHINEVKDWVLSWGPGARVLEPPCLVEEVRRDLRDMLATYDER